MILLGILFLLSGCVTALPVHHMESPETLGPWGFRVGFMTNTSPALATKDALSVIDDKGHDMTYIGSKLGIGIMEKFQINFEAGVNGMAGGTGIASLKWQYKGKPYFETKKGDKTSTFVIRSFNSAAADFDVADLASSEGDVIYRSADLNLTGVALTHLWGYRFTDMNGVYGGPQFIQGELKAEYRNTDDGPILEEKKRNINGYGIVAGYYFAGLGRNIGFDFVLEGQLTHLPATFASKYTSYANLGILIAIPFRF